ncbi:hypothetical protein VTN00DRAFT_8873 [Thermoascus crustaceus]|uniref:uncharacterized protein n=1 Tax=Thermoascus crustaceus TaxID=5088 RepID=UPI003743CD7B
MFYSHEILTSREHGVATIWLVATLGSKSAARKVNRKAILDVDVPKACDTIMHPEAPMALRLQGNLLYGVSRVYNQQCGYALTDTQAMHDRMRTMLKVVHGGGLDPDAGKARPDELVIPYDPSFVPEINLPTFDLDFASLSAMTEISSSRQSSLLLTQVHGSSLSSHLGHVSPRLDISSSDIVMGDFGVGGFQTASDMGSSVQKGGRSGGVRHSIFGDEEEGILLQPDFEFDEEGNIVELAVKKGPRDRVSQRQAASRNPSEAPITGRVREETGEGFLFDQGQPGEQMHLDEDNGALIGDENGILPPGVPFPRRRPGLLPDPDYIEEEEVGGAAPQTRETAMRRNKKRAPLNLPIDERQELRNADLAQWNNEYLRNMAVASKQKEQNRMVTQTRRNAAFWVFGQGIGSVGVGLGTSHVAHPLDQFSGEQLLATLQGQEPRSRGRKRRHGSVDESSEPGSKGRRVRPREEGDENPQHVSRGEEGMVSTDGDGIMHEDVEIGRHGPPSLHDDHSSQMPWNLTASIRGSRHGSSVGLPHPFGSLGEFSSRGGPGPLSATGFRRPGSRLTSASPLAGRGLGLDLAGHDALSSLSIPGNEGDDLDILGGFDLNTYLEGELDAGRRAATAGAGAEAHDSFQLFGPAAAVDTQTAAQSQWLAAMLDQESRNFLEFVRNRIEAPPAAADHETLVTKRRDGAEADDTLSEAERQNQESRKEITFSALLPPESNTRVVATQGLMHVLTLATKGILAVRQKQDADENEGEENAFGEIFLSVTES